MFPAGRFRPDERIKNFSSAPPPVARDFRASSRNRLLGTKAFCSVPKLSPPRRGLGQANCRLRPQQSVCVFFIWSRSFYTSTSSTDTGCADSSIIEKYSSSYSVYVATKVRRRDAIIHCLCSEQSSECAAVMSSYWMRQA